MIKIKITSINLIVTTTTMTDRQRPDNFTNTKLCMISLNINDLFDENKRQNLFQILENKKADIILLQKTHSTKEVEKKWQKKWKGKSFWHPGNTPKASGVAILLKENLDITLLKLNSNTGGRILSVEFLYENQHSQILNIYAPTRLPCRNKCYKNLKNTSVPINSRWRFQYGCKPASRQGRR